MNLNLTLDEPGFMVYGTIMMHYDARNMELH